MEEAGAHLAHNRGPPELRDLLFGGLAVIIGEKMLRGVELVLFRYLKAQLGNSV